MTRKMKRKSRNIERGKEVKTLLIVSTFRPHLLLH